MSYLKNILPVWGLLLLFFVASSSSVFGLTAGPPEEKTGAPNEGTCVTAGCHTGNVLNTAGGSLMLAIPETYEPGEVYAIVVNLSRAGQSKWGFQMTALDADGARAGTFAADDAANTQVSEVNSKQYIKHTAAGTAGASDAHSWEFEWTAPDADIGPIIFYAAGNAANGNFNPIDDYIYTTQEGIDTTGSCSCGRGFRNCRRYGSLHDGCRCRCELYTQNHEYWEHDGYTNA